MSLELETLINEVIGACIEAKGFPSMWGDRISTRRVKNLNKEAGKQEKIFWFTPSCIPAFLIKNTGTSHAIGTRNTD